MTFSLVSASSISPTSRWRPLLSGALGLAAAAGGSALVGWVCAQAGMKGALAGVAGLVFLAALMLIPRREEFVLGVTVLAVIALFHKAFGELANVSSGPPALYISSFDLMVGLLWLTWFVREPLRVRTELRELARHRVTWAPLAAIVLLLPSVLSAEQSSLAIAEVARMAAMYALFLYLAARVRTRLQVWIVLGALGVVGVIEAAVVAGQWVTKSALGLSLFGTPTILENRHDGFAVARPFGTMAHPVFMGAFMGALALMAFALAVNLRNTRLRLAALAISAIAVSPVALANARSAALGLVISLLALCAALLLRRRLSVGLAAKWLVAGMCVALLAAPWLSQLWSKSFHTDHFDLEVESRIELNHVAVNMFEARPFAGWGLNNFQQQMDRFDRHGLIFADNPVHNVYLLYLAEAGLFGLAALLVLGLSFGRSALRLTRSTDPLFSAVGYGVAAVYLFWAIEEFLVFSLRQDHPRALLFMLSGLCVACGRLAGTEPAPAGRGVVLDALIRVRVPQLRPLGRGAMSRASLAARALSSGFGGVAERGVRAGRAVGLAFGRRVRVAAAAERPERRSPGGPDPRQHQAAERPERRSPGGPDPRQRRRRPRRWATAIRDRRAAQPTRGHDRPFPAYRAAGLATVLTLLAGIVVIVKAPLSRAEGVPADLADAQLVFQAVDRTTGQRSLYTVAPGGEPVRLPLDGLGSPSYASWTPDGSHLAFSAHPPGSPDSEGAPEALYLVKPDGSDLRRLTANPWRNSQPKVSSDGQSVYFTSLWEEYPKVAVYRLDLATGLVTNLSARTRPDGAFDSDPLLLPDESGLLVADAFDTATGGSGPGKVALLSLDGATRRLLTTGRDGFDTDPAASPDGQTVAISRYVGLGTPTDPLSNQQFRVKLFDFRLVLHDIASGTERELTKGHDCTTRPGDQPCNPVDAPAWVPRFTPGGGHVGYVSVLSSTRVCICLVPRGGGAATVLVQSDQLAIDWYDWLQPKPGAKPPVATQAPPDRLLLGLGRADGTTQVHQAGPDRWGSAPLALDGSLRPLGPRWAADRQSVVYAGRPLAEVGPPTYGPPPPPGTIRQRHTLLDVGTGLPDVPIDDGDNLEPSQIYLTDLRTSQTRRLTSPGTEDWRDAIPDGEARANADPDISPDGRYVLFTNRSPHSQESFILRLDLVTGEVLSLTNATAGAMPVSDAYPRWSPDGTTVAFTSVNGESVGIWQMNADGYGARALVDDGFVNTLPTWSPDGRSLAYASYRGADRAAALQLAAAPAAPLAQTGWVLVRLDLATGEQRVLATPESGSVLSPVWSPDGRKVAFVSMTTTGRADIYTVPAVGGPVLPVQLTLGSTELWVDWR